MEIIVFLTFIAFVYGISNTVVFANGPFHIFKKMHDYLEVKHPMLNEGMSCMICMPWWVAIGVSFVNILLLPHIPITPMNLLIQEKIYFPIIIFLDGAIGSGMNWFVHTMQEHLEK